MTHIVNPNLRFLHQELKFKQRNELIKRYENKEITYEQFKEECKAKDIKAGVVLEGSSRSFKTISSLDFITMISSRYETGAVINIIRETYVSFKTTLYNDFNWRLPQFGIRSPFQNRQEVKSFMLFGNKINLIGADSESAAHGVGCDYLYINEALDVPKGVRDQAEMRCRKFFWYDLNPKFAEHDIFTQMLARDDIGHLKTTYKDNLQITPSERNKIESYQPVELSAIAIFLGSKDEDESKRHQAIQKALRYDCKANPDRYQPADLSELVRCQYNERTGTADKYMWMVYGLGERMAPEGVIFSNVTWITEFPSDVESIYYGSDFGYTVDPSVLVKIGIQGTNAYIQKLFYQPTPSPDDYIALISQHVTTDDIIWADPSGENGGRGFISKARDAGYSLYATHTYPGSIKFGIAQMKKYSLHLVDSPEMRKEQMGYVRAKARVNGMMVTTDDPVDANNHIWDAARMAFISNRL